MALLEVRGLGVRYGGVEALSDVDLDVAAGEIVGVLGGNGAGKTTLLDAISGITPACGRVAVDGHDVSGAGAHHRVRRGLVRTFQGATLFEALPVRDNLRVAARASRDVLRPGETAPAHRDDRVAAVAEFTGIAGLLDDAVHSLGGPARHLVDLAVALLLRPRILLLDEPAAGSHDVERAHLARLIRRCRDAFGVGILLVEHHVPLVMALADRVCVLDAGRVIAEGTPSTVRADPAVVAAYLGGVTEHAHAG